MKRNLLAGVVLTALLLGGCVTVDPANYTQTMARVTSEHDPYQNHTSYRAPPVSWTVNLFKFGTYFLRATRTTAGAEYPEMVQLYVQANIFGGWALLDSAHAAGGERIEVTRISTDVSCTSSLGCNHYETVGLNFSQDQFLRFAESGLDVQVSGRGGRVNFQVPATYFRAFGDAAGVQHGTQTSASTTAVGQPGVDAVDRLVPGVSTTADASSVMGEPTSVSVNVDGSRLLQWIQTSASPSSASIDHVAVLFDAEGRMVRVFQRTRIR